MIANLGDPDAQVYVAITLTALQNLSLICRGGKYGMQPKKIENNAWTCLDACSCTNIFNSFFYDEEQLSPCVNSAY